MIYVSSEKVDDTEGDGSITTPFKSIVKAANIGVYGGTYCWGSKVAEVKLAKCMYGFEMHNIYKTKVIVKL